MLMCVQITLANIEIINLLVRTRIIQFRPSAVDCRTWQNNVVDWLRWEMFTNDMFVSFYSVGFLPVRYRVKIYDDEFQIEAQYCLKFNFFFVL